MTTHPFDLHGDRTCFDCIPTRRTIALHGEPTMFGPIRHRRRNFRDTATAQALTIIGVALFSPAMAAVAAWLMTEAGR